MKTVLIIAAATAAITTPAVASATAINATEFNETIEHDDLDLSTQRGIARLDDRIRTEIRRACANGARDSQSIRLERACRESAYSSAQGAVRFAINQAQAERPRFASATTATNAATPGA
ncbi:MAG: UrcA family protein [Erythrobacter sp.]